MTTWYIDALDARGGLAFGTQRSSDLNDGALGSGGPTAFIAAPFFIPEAMEGRAVGFALARGYAQLGVFADGEEVPFDSLNALAEFVRRVYVRGAGGDGGGQNGGRPPSPRPEGSASSEGKPWLKSFEPDFKEDPVAQLMELGRRNSELIEALEFGHAREAESLNSNLKSSSQKQPAAQRLARGALHVLRELFFRRADTLEEKTSWASTMVRLGAVLRSMGIGGLVAQTVDEMSKTGDFFKPSPPRLSDVQQRALDLFSREAFPLHWCFWAKAECHDAMDDLVMFPVSSQYLKAAPSDGQNLQALLAALAGELSSSACGEEQAELLLFAAARLVLADRQAPGFAWVPDHSVLNHQFADDLARDALRWLSANVPKIVFSRQVETMIANSPLVAT